MSQRVFYRTVKVGGLSIFYREAGPKDAPLILLLHGFPSSSRMFEPLCARLSDSYHLVAPDYPGFGHSDWPDPKKFAYTFDHIAEIMNRFTEKLGLSRYNLYVQDYGGPVGFGMALAHPERVEALIVQDAVAHNEGRQADIQSDLFYDYRTNVDAYPKWQAWMREKQPRLQVIWGKYDLSFDLGEPERYRKDVAKAEVH